VNEKKDILVVPGKALRFTPDETTYSSYLKTLPEEDPKKDGLKHKEGESNAEGYEFHLDKEWWSHSKE